jgi:DNA topoisomerase-1
MDAITLEQALYLFQLPRTLGATADGEPIVASVGRFGPYIKYGAKYVSLKDDPYTVTLETALQCIRVKQEADANRIIQDFGVENIQVLNGRYGPYISNREKNARVPKGRDPKALTLEECRTLLEAAPTRPMRGRGRFGSKKTTAAPATTATAGATTKAAAARPRRARTPATAPTQAASVQAPTALAAKLTAPLKVKSHRQAKPAAAKPKAAAKSRAKPTRAARPVTKKAAGAA